MQAFATLKPQEQQALYLKGLGYSYHEIVSLMNSSYTATNRRISEGRAALRRGGRKPRDRERHDAPSRSRDTGGELDTEPPTPGTTAPAPMSPPRS